jgi:hypothetical protein
MSCQAQSRLSSTSHLPPRDPPPGPLNWLSAQRVIGQMPAYSLKKQLPQPTHFSVQTPYVYSFFF